MTSREEQRLQLQQLGGSEVTECRIANGKSLFTTCYWIRKVLDPSLPGQV